MSPFPARYRSAAFALMLGLCGTGKNALNATDTADATSLSKSSSFGVSIKLYENVSGAVKSVTSLPDRVGQARGAAGTAISAASETLRTVSTVTNALTNSAGISASFGFSKSKISGASQETAVVGSTVTGNSVTVRAAQDLQVTGSAIKAADGITLTAGRDAIFQSAQNTLATQAQSKSSGASIGVSVGFGIVGGANASAFANVSGSQSSGQSSETTQVNTNVTAGGTLALTTGRDATLKGAVVAGKTVVAGIGRDLAIQSVQDIAISASSSTGFSAGLTYSPMPGKSGVGANGGVSVGKGSGSSAIVAEQSALLARGGSLAATVTGNTDLEGGVIAALNSAGKDSGKLTLATGTLSASDIQDSAKSRDISIGVSVSVNDPFKKGVKGANTPTIDGHYFSATFEQDTKATIGQGQVVIAVPAANVTINRDLAQSQVVTKDTATGFSLYLDEAAIRETVALLKGDKANSTILQGVDTLTHDPLKPVREVINEVQSYSDHLPESGALERLVTGIDRLISGNNAVNLKQLNDLVNDRQFAGIGTAEGIASILIDRQADYIERTLGKDAAARFRAEAANAPAVRNLFLTNAQALLALRGSGGGITDPEQLIGIKLSGASASGSSNSDEIVVNGNRKLGDAVAQGLVVAQDYLDSIDPTLRTIIETGLSLGRGPVGALGSFALDKAIGAIAKETGLDKKAAKLVIGVGTLGLSILSSSNLSDEKATVDTYGPHEATSLTLSGVSILGIASIGKVVATYISKPKLIEIDINNAVKGTREFDLLNSALQPNSIYKLSDGTTFRTSKSGHVEELTFVPTLSQGTRDPRQTEVGKLGVDGDVGGHVQACSLGGSCDRFNLFPQDATFNNTDYKRFENDIRKALTRGDQVGPVTVKFVRIDPKNPRPDELHVSYIINGKKMTNEFPNGKGK